MRGEGVSCGVSASEYSCAHGAQTNTGDLTPFLTYGTDVSAHKIGWPVESDITAAPIGVWIGCNGCSYWLSNRVTVYYSLPMKMTVEFPTTETKEMQP